MRALQLVRTGLGPAGLEVVDRPVPQAGRGEVLIKVAAVSASKLELEQTMAGVGIGRAVRLPRTLGMDPAGTIVALGEDCAPHLLGRRVAVKPNLVCGTCAYCTTGQEADCVAQTMLGVHRDGGAADFVAVPASAAFPIPDELEFYLAAAAVHTVSVALHMFRSADSPGPERTILVLGASGAVGSAAVQIGARHGARVLAAVSGQTKSQQAMSDGAFATVDPYDLSEFAARVRMSAPNGVHAVLDSAGNPELFAAGIELLGWRGIAATCASQPGARTSIDTGALYRHRRTVLGVAGTDFHDVRAALEMVAQARVSPTVAGRFALDQAPEAYAALADRSLPGKVLIHVN